MGGSDCDNGRRREAVTATVVGDRGVTDIMADDFRQNPPALPSSAKADELNYFMF